MPEARALHAGSLSGKSVPHERFRMIYSNKLLVLARMLGSGFWLRLPLILASDLTSLGAALVRRHWSAVRGIPGGWLRAASKLHLFARSGPPHPSVREIKRWAP